MHEREAERKLRQKEPLTFREKSQRIREKKRQTKTERQNEQERKIQIIRAKI